MYPERTYKVRLPVKVIVSALGLAFLQLLSAYSFELRVSDDGRHFESADGKPFLYLGDTAWELFHRLDREDADHYLRDRSDKGFSVIQAVVLAELDGLKVPNAYGDLPLHGLDPTRPNEAYFRHVDYIVNRAEELGLVMGILPTWGDKVYSNHPGAGPIIFNPDNAYVYGEFLGKRYRGHAVIWILGGDRNVDRDTVFHTWRAMAKGIESGNGGTQLITFHPRGGSHSFYWFHNENWLDFNTYQSGHDERMKAVYKYAELNWMLHPPKPFVDSEPAYEDISVRFWDYVDFSRPHDQRVPEGVLAKDGTILKQEHFGKGFFTDHDVRVHGYWNLLSGAAGYTYGNNAIWQMWEPGRDAAIPCLTDWRQALDRPGAGDIIHMRNLFYSRDFGSLVPDQSLVFGPNRDGPDHMRAAITVDQSCAVLYFALGNPARIHTSKLKGDSLQGWWFNPRDGEATFIGKIEGGIETFTPPVTGTDWILVLERTGQYPEPPGDHQP